MKDIFTLWNIVGIILLLFLLIMEIVATRKASKERLESFLKTEIILSLCFLPTFILLFFLLFRAFPEGMSVFTVIKQNFILFVWPISLIIIWLYTSILYFRKQKEIKIDSENEKNKYHRTIKVIMIPAFELPLLLFPFLLLDRNIRSNCLLLSFIAQFYVFISFC